MSYDHNFKEQPELLAVGQRSGRAELLSRADLEKTGSLKHAASVEQSQSWRNFETIHASKVRVNYIIEQQGWVAACVSGTAFSIVDR